MPQNTPTPAPQTYTGINGTSAGQIQQILTGFISASSLSTINNLTTSVSQYLASGAAGINIASASNSPILPSITFFATDSSGKKISMTLKPEPSISAFQALKIVMLLQACSAQGAYQTFSVYEYVKANNLECHFTFAEVKIFG